MPDAHVRQINVMISSTRADLDQYRQEASKVIKRVATEKEKQVQLLEESMEKETQSGDREFAVAVSKHWVEKSDWVVVIVGWNYGTISDEAGADGLSVTEWEFRHASDLGKKLFVFIAGDLGTTNQYRVTNEEKEDLKDWKDKQSEEQAIKLKKFRQQLSGRHAEMFANLQMFRERLEKTLKDKIDDLRLEIKPGSPLDELIVAVTPDIRECIRKVSLTANFKRIHDYLHELLQNVIRPLREEVLSKWKEEGTLTLSMSMEKKIWGCVNKASRQLGGISEVRKSIGPEHLELRNSVDKVLQLPELWNIELDSPDPRPSVYDFAEVMDKFAEAVQDAFSDADRSMTIEESDLRECYLALLDGLKHARQQRNLSASDQQRLDDELEKVDTNRSRVKNSLTTHHRWQEAHDKLHVLDSFRETDKFDRVLDHYRETWLAKLLDLVEKELEHVDVHRAGATEPEQGAVTAVVQQGLQPSSQGSPDVCGAFVDDMRRLKERLEALRQGEGADAFDKMRNPFDNAFYCIDKRTLEEVSGAGERVRNLEKWLDELATERRKVD